VTGQQTAECIHGLDTPAWCSICRHGPTAPRAGLHPDTPDDDCEQMSQLLCDGVFGARHPGHCPGCNLPIHVGQPIARWSDRRYRHDGCTP
jgi:hypothetical protein